MGGMAGQPAPKPGSLGKPVPGSKEQDEISAYLADYSAPQVSTSDPEVDAYLQQSGAPTVTDASVQDTGLPTDDQFAPEMGSSPQDVLQANVDQFRPDNIRDRIATGLAATDEQKVRYLQDRYGEKNATMKDGEIYFRKAASEKFKRFDPDTFEVVADLLLDNSRAAITEAVATPAELAGGAAGFLGGFASGVVPAIPAAGAGAVAGRMASIPVSNEIADKLAGAMGVPEDESRNKTLENDIGMAVELGIPVVGKYIAKPIMNMVKRRIPGTVPYYLAKEAGEKEAVALSKQSQEVVQALKQLSDEGVNIPMMAQDIHPDSPSLLTKAAKAQQDFPGQFAQRQMDVAQGYGAAVQNTLAEIAPGMGAGPVKTEALGSVVTNAVEALDYIEGKEIKFFRDQAIATLKNQKQQLPQEISQTALSLMKQLGFQPKRVTLNSVTRPGSFSGAAARGGMQVPNKIERVMWQPPKNLEPFAGRLGLQDPGQTRAVVNILNEYGQLMSRGNEARLTDVERLINRMGPMNDRLDGQIGAAWGGMTSQLRKFRREIIGNSLSETDKFLFNKTMDKFSMIRENTNQLKNVLRDDVTAKTMVGAFFKGKENLANIRAIKAIAGENSVAWGSLRDEFVNQLMIKHGDRTSKTGLKSGAFLDDLRKTYGDDFIAEVIPSKQMEKLKNLLIVGERIETRIKGITPDGSANKQLDAAADALVGTAAGIRFKQINGFMNMFKLNGKNPNALMELFNRNGYEKHVAGYKGDKGRAAAVIEEMLKRYNASQAAAKVSAGAEVTKRGAKALIREDVMGHD